MSKKNSHAWKPQEPASDFVENVMARILADPPPHVRAAAARATAKSLARRKKTVSALTIALAVFLAAALLIAGVLGWPSSTRVDKRPEMSGDTPVAAPSNAPPAQSSEAPESVPSSAPDRPQLQAPKTLPEEMHSKASIADLQPAPTASPSTGARRDGGPNVGGSALGPGTLGPFDETAARAALERAFKAAKASCKALAGVETHRAIITVTFQPTGIMSGIGNIQWELEEQPDTGAKQEGEKQDDCISSTISSKINTEGSIPPFEGPPATRTYTIEF